MKITKSPSEPEFTPISITITMETHREYALVKQFFGSMSAIDIMSYANKCSDPLYTNFDSDEVMKLSKVYEKLG
jgi:hypothetical protein